MASGKAWYWLAVGVLALGLNSEYQSGRLHWARQATDQSLALMERATDQTMHYVTLAEVMLGDNPAERRPAQAAVARVQAKIACVRMAVAQKEAQKEIEKARPDLMKARFDLSKTRIMVAAQDHAAAVVCRHVSRASVTEPDLSVLDSPDTAEVEFDGTF